MKLLEITTDYQKLRTPIIRLASILKTAEERFKELKHKVSKIYSIEKQTDWKYRQECKRHSEKV